MTASCESPVRTYERFTVTYTLLNNLQDFLAVRLVWTPEHAQAGRSAARWGSDPQGGEKKGKSQEGWTVITAKLGASPTTGGDLWQVASALYLGHLPSVLDGEFREAVGQSDFQGIDTGAALAGVNSTSLFY